MKLKIVIVDLEIPPRVKRWGIRIGIPAVLLVGAGAVAVASVPTVWTGGQVLTAAALNANFTALDARITALEALPAQVTALQAQTAVTIGSVSYSVGATKYCGVGPTSTAGAISYNGVTGYAGAKAMCQASLGCGMSPTAHMCTADELIRSSQLGAAPSATGWYAAGVYSEVTTTPVVEPAGDCDGWTTASGTALGADWESGPSFAVYTSCSGSYPILCCN
jgi:hypothetical protein